MVFDGGAVPENLIESELFGHIKGAFTDAISTRRGVFERAYGGTVFLDEIGELPLALQSRLLRVLEARKVMRLGDAVEHKVNVRVIAATNRDLQAEVAAKRFRADLYFRLAVVRIKVPPLRQRLDDLPMLVDDFVGAGERPPAEILTQLRRFSWPGNLRQLRNVVDVAALYGWNHALSDLLAKAKGRFQSGGPFKDAKERMVGVFERDYLVDLMKRHGGRVLAAAEEAAIDRNYLARLLRKHGITPKTYKRRPGR
jgi:DNA-binding NtrC family response regulator